MVQLTVLNSYYSVPNILRGHFLTKPTPPVLSILETTRDQVQLATDLSFAKQYAVFFCSFILLAYIVAWIRQDTRSELDILRSEICAKVPASPACKHPEVLTLIDTVATKHNVPTRLITGIYFAESTLWINFNKPPCSQYHNWAWLKWRKFHDNSVEYYSTNRKRPDANGCWLYRFDSFEWATLMSLTLSKWYHTCFRDNKLPENQTKCISWAYVWAPDKAEQSWINRVSVFYPNSK